MTPALTLHLGDFRTGTTAIQGWLRQHGGAHGIAYPPGHNQASLAQALPDPAARADQFGRIARFLEQASAPHAVISAEHFELADPGQLAEALLRYLPAHTAQTRLIAYVRPHPQAYLARFAESTKIGSFTGPLEAYLDWVQPRMTYGPRFARWKAVFGDRFTLRLYDRARFTGGDVVRDFAHFVTGRDPGAGMSEANPTPGIEALALARALHRRIGALPPEGRHAQWTLGRHLGRQLGALGQAQTPLALHRALALRLQQAFAADAAETDAAFFDGTPLSDALAAAPEQAPAQAQSLEPADHLSAQTLQIIALWGDMLRHGLTAPDGAAALNRLYHE